MLRVQGTPGLKGSGDQDIPELSIQAFDVQSSVAQGCRVEDAGCRVERLEGSGMQGAGLRLPSCRAQGFRGSGFGVQDQSMQGSREKGFRAQG